MKYYGIIYKILNKVNGKVYIGQTTERNGFNDRYRYNGQGIERVYKYHKSRKERELDYNSHLLRAIEKYGFQAFEITEIFDTANSREELDEKEMYWIDYFDSFYNGYNQTKGGGGGCGWCPSEETRERMSKSHMGENNHMFGKRQTEETRDKISQAHLGKTLSQEHKQKLSEIFSGENNPMFGLYGGEHPSARAVICVTTNEIFPSTIEGGEKYEISPQNIRGCCDRDSQIRYAGRSNGRYLIWRYYDEYQNFTDKELNELIEIRNELTKSVICLTTKRIFDNPTEGARYYGIKKGCDIGYCCRGSRIKNGKKIRTKSAGKLSDGTKLVWRYLNFFHNTTLRGKDISKLHKNIKEVA